MPSLVTRSFLCAALAAALAACSDAPAAPRPAPSMAPILDEQGRVPPLSCPGAASCASATGELRVGAAKVAITPAVETWTDTDGNGAHNDDEPFDDLNGNGQWDGVWLAGFGNARAATSVHDDVWARALVLEQGDVSIGLLALDLVGFFHDDVLAIRQAARDAGLPFDHVVVATTHNHQGPDTMGIWGPATGISGYDAAYVQRLRERAVQALKEAHAAARPATLRFAQTEAPELVNDTRLPKVIDQALTAVLFRDAQDNEAIASAVFWGNHPEALGSNNSELTSDFPHYLRDELEQAHPDAVALYFNGSLGGLSTTIGIVGCPDGTGEQTCPQGTFARAEYVGRGAASRALSALAASDAVEVGSGAAALGFERRSRLLTTTNGALALAFTLGLLPRNLFSVETGAQLSAEEQAVVGLGEIVGGNVALQTELNLLRLGPLAIAMVPGELYPELWLTLPDGQSLIERPEGADFPDAPKEPALSSLLPAGTVSVIVNNANDALGYIIPKAQWDQVKPYAYVTGNDPQYGEVNSLGPDTAAALAETFSSLTLASGAR